MKKWLTEKNIRFLVASLIAFLVVAVIIFDKPLTMDLIFKCLITAIIIFIVGYILIHKPIMVEG